MSNVEMPDRNGDAPPTLLRSLLFCPANRPDMTHKLAASAADAVVLDLEDGTPAAQQAAGRLELRSAVERLSRESPGIRVFVRTSPLDSELFAEDLEAALSCGAEGLVIPKVGSAEQLQALERLLAWMERRLEIPPRTIVVGLETAAGVHRADSILLASTRVCAVYFGAEDFASDVGARRSVAGDEVRYARSRVVIAARLGGVPAIDQAVLEIRDEARFRADAEQGRDLGYAGKLCVHPRQAEVANEVFTPSPDEIEHSRRLLEAYEASLAEGRATLEYEGQMIDTPLVERARRSLELAAAAAARRA
ncbi:MAG: citrate lyase subunit beta / citryl-CoA lyase [Solirubrobacteraceae bacterium]|jgi:citrate lyase subunit beta/citryl-CoA lyase|nr:citrate lyase subunit beta / citryl-CoA lyase [Solirubrobacteraceae bacterium]MEA2396126.1 citrate lyase subunit beta / citryl-CoA lyase [Solirubrobacteraceae bacterium]